MCVCVCMCIMQLWLLGLCISRFKLGEGVMVDNEVTTAVSSILTAHGKKLFFFREV